MIFTMKRGVVAGLLVLVGGGMAHADVTTPGDFSLSIGYANISVGDSSSELYSQNALKFDPAFTIAPIPTLPQLRLGAAFGVAMVIDNSSRTFISNNGQLIVSSSGTIPFILLEPEARISWRQSFGAAHQFFVEPGFAIGGAFGYVSVSSDDSSTSESYDKWASTYQGKVFLYAGMQVAGGLAGIEMSYMQGGNMDLADNADGDLREYYIGIFGSIQF